MTEFKNNKESNTKRELKRITNNSDKTTSEDLSKLLENTLKYSDGKEYILKIINNFLIIYLLKLTSI